MIRKFTALTALAALTFLAAAPANAESLTVSLKGMTTAERYGAILTAAEKVCYETSFQWRAVESECVAATLQDTVAKIGDPALLQYAQSINYAKLASN